MLTVAPERRTPSPRQASARLAGGAGTRVAVEMTPSFPSVVHVASTIASCACGSISSRPQSPSVVSRTRRGSEYSPGFLKTHPAPLPGIYEGGSVIESPPGFGSDTAGVRLPSLLVVCQRHDRAFHRRLATRGADRLEGGHGEHRILVNAQRVLQPGGVDRVGATSGDAGGAAQLGCGARSFDGLADAVQSGAVRSREVGDVSRRPPVLVQGDFGECTAARKRDRNDEPLQSIEQLGIPGLGKFGAEPLVRVPAARSKQVDQPVGPGSRFSITELCAAPSNLCQHRVEIAYFRERSSGSAEWATQGLGGLVVDHRPCGAEHGPDPADRHPVSMEFFWIEPQP